MGIFPVDIINMKCRRQRILPEIIKSKQCGKSGSSHAAHQRAFLGIKPVRPDTLVSHQMERLIFFRIVCLLEHRHVVHATFMKILIFIHIDRIDLDSDIFKIFPRDLYSFSNVFHIGISAALTGQNQNFFHTGLRNDLHLMLNLFKIQLLPPDIIIAVEPAVNAVVLAIIGNVQWCENINGISKMIFGNLFCFSRHLLQIRCCRRRQECLKILNGTGFMRKCPLYICCRIGIVVKFIHGFSHFILDIRLNDLHAFHIFHMVGTEGRVLFQTMFSLQCCWRQFITVYKIYLIFFIHDSDASLTQETGQRIGCTAASCKHSSHTGQICFSTCLDCQLEGSCHLRYISSGCNCGICHNSSGSHLHCLTGLGRFSDTGVHNNRQINLIDEYLNHGFGCQSFVTSNGCCQRHHSSCTCILKVSGYI